MFTLLDSIYYRFKKEEIEKARAKLKMVKIDTILENLTKICWKSNIEYKIIIKTSHMLTIKFVGMKQTVLFKYHKTDMVLKEEMDFFMSELDENKAHKGVYITTGEFEKKMNMSRRRLFPKKDIIFQDGYSLIKEHLSTIWGDLDFINRNMFKFFKYLPQ